MRMRSAPWLFGAIVVCVGHAGAADSPLDRFDLTTRIDLEWAVDTGTGDTHELAVTLQPELEVELPFGLDLTGIARARADFFDRLEPGAPVPHEVSRWTRRGFVGSSSEGELRELYVDARVAGVFLRLGKQQVVWGEADGLKLLDVVNPQHFREFILPVFEDSRIPLWTANVEIPIRDVTLQLLWIPDPTHHELPEADALFAITSQRLVPPPPPAGVPVLQRQVKRPPKWFEDSDAGLRLAGFWKGFDWTLNYLWQYGDFPVLVRRLPAAPGGAVLLAPEYRRLHQVGGSASTAFGELTVRAELGLALDRYLPVDDATDRDGIAETGDVGWMLGLDWFGFEETLISFQLFQSWLPGHRSTMLRKQLDTNLTLVLQRELWNDRLLLELQILQSWNDRDGLVRPRIAWEWRDDTTLSLGADFFHGTAKGIFGQYDANDRVWLQIRFSR
jgi:hypothetical protein